MFQKERKEGRMGGQAKNETPLASIFSETTLKNTKKLDFLFFMVLYGFYGFYDFYDFYDFYASNNGSSHTCRSSSGMPYSLNVRNAAASRALKGRLASVANLLWNASRPMTATTWSS